MPPKRKFSAETDREIQRMYTDGVSVEKISKIYGVCIHSIRNALYRGGMKKDRVGPPHKLSPSTVEECRKMYEQGVSLERLGAIYSVTDTCLRGAFIRAGIKMHQVGEFCKGKRVAVFKDGEWVRYDGSQRQKDNNLRHVRERRAKFEIRTAVDRAKQRAREKGFPFSLDAKDIKTPEFCPVLGIKMRRYTGRGGPMDDSPTLDRIKGELGYVSGNVRVISNKANRIKNNATCEEVELVLADMRRLDGILPPIEGDEALWL